MPSTDRCMLIRVLLRDSRWLRLLFTREFSMDDAMVLWDGLFACDPSFDLAPWICVAMLIRIRNKREYLCCMLLTRGPPAD